MANKPIFMFACLAILWGLTLALPGTWIHVVAPDLVASTKDDYR